MAENFLIYTLDDLDGDLTEGGFTSVSSNPSPTSVAVNDDDNVLDTILTGDPNQVLAADLVINGVLVGLVGDPIEIGAETDITNFGNGFESGTFSGIIVNGVFVGFTSTISLSPGDALGIGPTTALPDSQDYADLVACFTRDTKILCERGEVFVQDLEIGDLVVTLNNALQPIRWVGSQKTSGLGTFAPVRFKTGSLNNSSDVLVSPMHRMLIDGPRAELLFGESEMLAHAKDLRDGDQVFIEPHDSVEYFHILFDEHQIINAHGCWSESFAPRHASVDAFEEKSREEVLKLFPHLEEGWQDALPTLTAHEAALFAAK